MNDKQKLEDVELETEAGAGADIPLLAEGEASRSDMHVVNLLKRFSLYDLLNKLTRHQFFSSILCLRRVAMKRTKCFYFYELLFYVNTLLLLSILLLLLLP
jgi:hypothetical protein